MEGRTTFVIAHRLSTIALADRVIVMEGGRITAQGTHEELLDSSALYAEIVDKGMPRLGAALSGLDGGEPDEDEIARREGGAVMRLIPQPDVGSQRPRPAAAPARRGRAAAPLPRARDRGVRVAGAGDGGEPRSSLSREARDRRRHHARRPPGAEPDRGGVHRRGAPVLGRDVPADLPGRMGRPARAAGPAAADLHAPPAPVDRLLQPAQDRRADLAPDERHPGARPARHRRHRDALLEHARRWSARS